MTIKCDGCGMLKVASMFSKVMKQNHGPNQNTYCINCDTARKALKKKSNSTKSTKLRVKKDKKHKISSKLWNDIKAKRADGSDGDGMDEN